MKDKKKEGPGMNPGTYSEKGIYVKASCLDSQEYRHFACMTKLETSLTFTFTRCAKGGIIEDS